MHQYQLTPVLTEPTVASGIAVTTVAPEIVVTTTVDTCRDFCADPSREWAVKCTWETFCAGCSECSDSTVLIMPTVLVPIIPDPTTPTTTTATNKVIFPANKYCYVAFCSKSKRLWKFKCTWSACAECDECSEREWFFLCCVTWTLQFLLVAGSAIDRYLCKHVRRCCICRICNTHTKRY